VLQRLDPVNSGFDYPNSSRAISAAREKELIVGTEFDTIDGSAVRSKLIFCVAIPVQSSVGDVYSRLMVIACGGD
jgi:hypothetical protein